jgi:hypothetical protein
VSKKVMQFRTPQISRPEASFIWASLTLINTNFPVCVSNFEGHSITRKPLEAPAANVSHLQP